MGNAAIAAQTYQSGLKNADPIGAYAAGIQVRTSLQRIDLAQEAQRSNDLFEMLKIGIDRQESQAKTELAKEQLRIAEFNAQTGRMNAQRAANKASGSGGSGINIWDAIKSDADGMYFDPSALSGSHTDTTEGAAGTPEVGATDVMPLPSGGSGTPRVLPDSRAGALPLPTGSDTGTIAASPLLPYPGDTAAPAAPANVAATGASASRPASGKLRLSTISVNAKGQPSLSFKADDPKDAPGPNVTPDFLAAMNKAYAHLGGAFVPDVDTKGKLSYAWQKSDTLHSDFSISSLPEKVQTSFLEDVTKMIEAGAEIENPSDTAKMQAAGIDPKDKNAAKMMLERGLWDSSYATAKKEKENELLGTASTYAKKWNAQMAGKPGFVPKSGLDVLRDIGITSVQPQQAAPAAPQRNSPPAAPAGATTAATVPARAAEPAGASSDNAGQIQQLEQEIAAETDPKVKRQKENFLASMRQNQPAAKAPAASAATEDPWSLPAKATEKPAPESNVRADASRQQWENGKASVVRALKSTMTEEELSGFSQSLQPRSQENVMNIGRGGKTPEKWLEENGDKLGIKPKDGGKLTMESVIFTDHEGRGIRLRDIMRATLQDPRMKLSRSSQGETQAKNGFTVSVGKPTEVK